MDNKDDYDRGRIEEINLHRSIKFNGNLITKAVIEIDHINHGLNSRTKRLNTKKRTSFTVKDIEEFIMLLDGEHLCAEDYTGPISKYSIRVDCPIKGRFYKKEFIMIFDTHYGKEKEIHTITLFPGW